jgi:hypothetical protein
MTMFPPDETWPDRLRTAGEWMAKRVRDKMADTTNILPSRMNRDELVNLASNFGAPMGTIRSVARQSMPLESVKKAADELSERWRQLGVENFLSMDRDGGIVLSKVVVPTAARGQGVGSSFMQELSGLADEASVPVRLTPSGDFGGSVPRLKKFYSGFGFIENKGRNKDFTTREAMYRNPGGKK